MFLIILVIWKIIGIHPQIHYEVLSMFWDLMWPVSGFCPFGSGILTGKGWYKLINRQFQFSSETFFLSPSQTLKKKFKIQVKKNIESENTILNWV